MPTMLVENAFSRFPPASGVLLRACSASTSTTPGPAELRWADPRRAIPQRLPTVVTANRRRAGRIAPLDGRRRCQAAVGLHTPQPAIRALEDRRAVTRREDLVVWRQLAQAVKLPGGEQHVHTAAPPWRTAPSRRSRISSEERKSSRCSGATCSA